MDLYGRNPDRNTPLRAELIGCELAWRRSGTDWVLTHRRRRMAQVVSDDKRHGMFRIALPSGRLSDFANLSWAKSAALEAAIRELEWERRFPAITAASRRSTMSPEIIPGGSA